MAFREREWYVNAAILVVASIKKSQQDARFFRSRATCRGVAVDHSDVGHHGDLIRAPLGMMCNIS